MTKFLWANTIDGKDIVINVENIICVLPTTCLPKDYQIAIAGVFYDDPDRCAVAYRVGDQVFWVCIDTYSEDVAEYLWNNGA